MTELSVHTELLNKGAIAANRRIFALDRHPINDIGVSQGRTELKDRSDIGRLTAIGRTIASGASAEAADLGRVPDTKVSVEGD